MYDCDSGKQNTAAAVLYGNIKYVVSCTCKINCINVLKLSTLSFVSSRLSLLLTMKNASEDIVLGQCCVKWFYYFRDHVCLTFNCWIRSFSVKFYICFFYSHFRYSFQIYMVMRAHVSYYCVLTVWRFLLRAKITCAYWRFCIVTAVVSSVFLYRVVTVFVVTCNFSVDIHLVSSSRKYMMHKLFYV